MIKIFANISAFSSLLPFIAGIYNYKQLGKGRKVFFFLIAMMVLADLTMVYLSLYKKNNLMVMNLNILVEVLLIYKLYDVWFSGKYNKLLIIVAAIYTAFWIGSFMLYANHLKLDIVSISTGNILIATISLSYLFNLSRTANDSFITNPRFIISSGIFIYFLSTTLIFAVYEYLTITKLVNPIGYYAFHSFLNILINGVYAVGLAYNTPKVL